MPTVLMQPIQQSGDLKMHFFSPPLCAAIPEWTRAIVIGQPLHSELLWSLPEALYEGRKTGLSNSQSAGLAGWSLTVEPCCR